jgi:hypothetical protein
MTELPEEKAFRAPYTFQPSAIPAKKFCKIVFTLSVGAYGRTPLRRLKVLRSPLTTMHTFEAKQEPYRRPKLVSDLFSTRPRSSDQFPGCRAADH